MSGETVQVEMESRLSSLQRLCAIQERNLLAVRLGARQANIALIRHAKSVKFLRKHARRWVPVGKHLPTDGKEKIVAHTEAGVIRSQSFATYSGGQWIARGNRLLEGVTHWQDSPEWPTS